MLPSSSRLTNTAERASPHVIGAGSLVTRLLAIAGALVVSLGVAAPVPAQEAPLATWQVAWQQQLPFLTAQPQIVGGTIRAFAGNDVLSLDLATGATLWRVQPPPPQGQALLQGCCQTGAAPTETGLYTLAGGNEVCLGGPRWAR